MPGLFDGTPLERPVTCEACGEPRDLCACPRDATGAVRRPADQPARVRLERRAGRRLVTTVHGLDPVASDLPSLVAALRRRCGAGGTVTAGGVIEVQGDHRDRVVEELRALGYPAK